MRDTHFPDDPEDFEDDPKSTTSEHFIAPCSKIEGFKGYRESSKECSMMAQVLDMLEDHGKRISDLEGRK